MASPFAPVSAADDLCGLFEAEATMPRASLVSEDAARAKLVQWTFAVSRVLNLFFSPDADRRRRPSACVSRLIFFSSFDGPIGAPFFRPSFPLLPLFFRSMGSRERSCSLEISKRALERVQRCSATASLSRSFFSHFPTQLSLSFFLEKKLSRSRACTASPRRPPPAPSPSPTWRPRPPR